MSVLETPRILFRGRVTWDPIVTNNDSTYYDENAAAPVFSGDDPVASFRASAIAAVTTDGVWNPHGTHRSVFYETTVVGVDLGKGTVIDDAFVGRPVSFQGMLVDVEPYGTFSSQLFFDAMSFGIDGGCRVFAPRRTRMIARYINFTRNLGPSFTAGGASVVWQTSFAKDEGLRVDTHGSAALEALGRALEDDDVLGLTVRWNSYRTIYFDDDKLVNAKRGQPPLPATVAATEALQAKLLGGGFQPNPARSYLVGSLGLWRRGEPIAVPGDRLLQSVEAAGVGSAFARLSPDRLTIDLGNSVSETDPQLTKALLGVLSVVAVDPAGVAADEPLGELRPGDYDRDAYERTAGIVTLPLSAAQASLAASRDLVVRSADGKTEYLHEAPLLACPDEPSVYLDQGEARTVRVRIFERGVAPGRPVPLAYARPGSARSTTVQSDADGVAELSFVGHAGNVESFVLVPGEGAPIPDMDPQRVAYLYVRTLPTDDTVANAPATWANVYQLVLQDWNAMAPCMDNWLRLDDPVQVAAYGKLLRRLTAKENFESFRFMPVTRDLTASQRTLLYRWLDEPQPDAKPGALEAAQTVARPLTRAQKNQAFRKA